MKSLIDKLDLEILKLLSQNSKISYTEISTKLKVSNTTVHVRVNRLQKLEVIKNFTITIDYNKLGFSYACYMGIYMDKASQYENVLQELLKMDNITGMDFTTGKFSLFCKIRALDSQDARRVITKIHKIRGVNRTETFISLEQLLNQKESLLSTVEMYS
jgi:Lrp/AsnC family transcriptional regulator for asnA, asnC and gidA